MPDEPLLVTAADGMPVRVLPTPPDAFMGAAIGLLAPNSHYAVHFHFALEQLSYVLKGRVAITMGGQTHHLKTGEVLVSPPGVTLDFANDSDEPAEVLFVCAPPFPPDGADVALAGAHRPLTEAEHEQARQRLAWALDHFRRVGQSRLLPGRAD